jgi:hypothetical protein
MVFHVIFEKLSSAVSLPVQSMLSLLLMGGVCIYAAVNISNNECEPIVALWEVLPFILSTVGCIIGFAVESYLLIIGKPFELELFPKVASIRAGNIVLVTTTKLIFIMTLCLGAAKPAGVVETYSIYAAIVYAAYVYPLVFVGIPENTENVSKLVLIARMLVALIAGPTYGGLGNDFVLIMSEYIPLYCVVNVDHSTPLGSTCLHVYNSVAYLLTFLAVKLAQNACEDQCYAQGYEKEVSFPFIFLAATVAGGLVNANAALKKKETAEVQQEGYENIVD